MHLNRLESGMTESVAGIFIPGIPLLRNQKVNNIRRYSEKILQNIFGKLDNQYNGKAFDMDQKSTAAAELTRLGILAFGQSHLLSSEQSLILLVAYFAIGLFQFVGYYWNNYEYNKDLKSHMK